MDRSLDFIFTFAAIVIGIMLLTGNGGIFMKGGDAQKRNAIYDQKKMEKASGVALLLIGIATGIDSFTVGVPAKVGYIVVVFVILAGLIVYLRKKCRK